MKTPEEAVHFQLSIFEKEDWRDLYDFLHQDIKEALQPIFKRIREEENTDAIDSSIFSELFSQYSADDFTEKEFDLIGIVAEGKSIAHAIIRVLDSPYPLETSWVETLSFCKENDEWKALLTTYFVANLLTQYESD